MTNLMTNEFDNAVFNEAYAGKEDVYDQIARLQAELKALKGETTVKEEVKVDSNLKKNQKPGKASASRKYVVAGPMLGWGKVPQQQADIAALLLKNMEVGKEYTEQEVFNFLIDGSGDYPSLFKSTQDVTYLFRYYRGLKNNGKHAGFIARDFLRMI
jgi:hypothetical protein